MRCGASSFMCFTIHSIGEGEGGKDLDREAGRSHWQRDGILSCLFGCLHAYEGRVGLDTRRASGLQRTEIIKEDSALDCT